MVTLKCHVRSPLLMAVIIEVLACLHVAVVGANLNLASAQEAIAWQESVQWKDDRHLNGDTKEDKLAKSIMIDEARHPATIPAKEDGGHALGKLDPPAVNAKDTEPSLVPIRGGLLVLRPKSQERWVKLHEGRITWAISDHLDAVAKTMQLNGDLCRGDRMITPVFRGIPLTVGTVTWTPPDVIDVAPDYFLRLWSSPSSAGLLNYLSPTFGVVTHPEDTFDELSNPFALNWTNPNPEPTHHLRIVSKSIRPATLWVPTHGASNPSTAPPQVIAFYPNRAGKNHWQPLSFHPLAGILICLATNYLQGLWFN